MYLAIFTTVRPYEFLGHTEDDARSGLREALEKSWRRRDVPFSPGWERDIYVRRIVPGVLMVNGREFES